MESMASIEDCLNWQDNEGYLCGSFIKFAKNGDELVLLDDPKFETRQQALLRALEADEISACLNCGVLLLTKELLRKNKYCASCSVINPESLNIINSRGAASPTEVTNETGRAPMAGTSTESDSNKVFTWSSYLQERKGLTKAPERCFTSYQLVPPTPNKFEIGNRMDTFDPLNFARLTSMVVNNIKGQRLCLQYTCKKDDHYYWVDANSPLLIPSKQSSKFIVRKKDGAKERGVPAPLEAFPYWVDPEKLVQQTEHLNSLGFCRGYKLEALDKTDIQFTICVATISEVFGEYILIHFDGWGDEFDFWTHYTSPFIHPVDWSTIHKAPLAPPCNYHKPKFSWSQYLKETNSKVVPKSAFQPRLPREWKVGMCLEVVDYRNPQLIRVASVAEVKYYHIKVHWEGWPSVYDSWIEDDSPDLHPIGYCEATGHELQPPLGCMHDGKRTIRCWPNCKKQSLGNEQLHKFFTHNKVDYCPYKEMMDPKKIVIVDYYEVFYNQYFFAKLSRQLSLPSTSTSTFGANERNSIREKPKPDETFQPPPTLSLDDLNMLDNYYAFQLSEVRSTVKVGRCTSEIGDDTEVQEQINIAHSILEWDVQQCKDFVRKFTKSDSIADTFAREHMDGVAILNAPKEAFEYLIPNQVIFQKFYNEILSIKEKLVV